ncbi:MAG: lasso peptide biosynthesis B2 protein [Pseudonocardiaceae bacterium]
MTRPGHLPERRPLAPRRRIIVVGAVIAARFMARLRPSIIRRFLTTLRKGSRPAHYSETLADRDDVVSASLICAGEGCLPRSLAVCFLGRIHGRWPTWCTGVRMEPFRAHAWVEADGQQVGEPYSMDAYAVTMRI